MSKASTPVKIELSLDQALVLFEMLVRAEDSGVIPSSDRGEKVALWSLEAALERQLAEPFMASYLELLEAARARLRDRFEEEPT